MNQKRRRFGIPFAFIAALTVSVLSYQNCTEPAPGGNKSSASLKVDFAYDTSLDQITYMSCHDIPLSQNAGFDRSAYFSVRGGAYRKGGLKLLQNFFLNEVVAGRTPEKMATLLAESPANNSTVLQLAIRQANDYQSLVTASGAAKEGDDFQNMFDTLGTSAMSTVLVNMYQTPSAARMKFIRNGTVQGGRIEGSLYYTSNHVLAESIRNYFRNGAQLAVTYTERGASSNTLHTARSPDSVAARIGDAAVPPTTTSTKKKTTNEKSTTATAASANSVYGRGYVLSFRVPEKNPAFELNMAAPMTTTFPALALSGVSESSLLKGFINPDIGTWTCPTSLQFRIVLADDATGRCETGPDDYATYPDLKIVRNQLKVEDWWVNMAKKCIVPKKPNAGASCYGNQRYVEYDLTKTCYMGINNNGPTLKVCQSFASVCYRTN